MAERQKTSTGVWLIFILLFVVFGGPTICCIACMGVGVIVPTLSRARELGRQNRLANATPPENATDFEWKGEIYPKADEELSLDQQLHNLLGYFEFGIQLSDMKNVHNPDSEWDRQYIEIDSIKYTRYYGTWLTKEEYDSGEFLWKEGNSP